MAETIDAPTMAADIHAIELDEMWHFLQSKKGKSGSATPWIIAQGEPWPGYSVVVMLQPSSGSMTNEHISPTASLIQISGKPWRQSSRKAVTSSATRIRMRLRVITPIRDITSRGWYDGRKLSPNRRPWCMPPSSCGVHSRCQRSSRNINNYACRSLTEHSRPLFLNGWDAHGGHASLRTIAFC